MADFTPDEDYILVPAPKPPELAKKGHQCGLCGMKFDFNTTYGFCWEQQNCPMGWGRKDKTVSASDIAKRFGVSRATIQRGLRRDREDTEAKELDKLLKAQKRAARAGKK